MQQPMKSLLQRRFNAISIVYYQFEHFEVRCIEKLLYTVSGQVCYKLIE